MTVYQSQSNGYVAFKVQSGLGVPASGAGGTILRQTGGSGANLTKAAVQSNEVRQDGMMIRGRHGTQKTTGQWTAEMSIGSHETIIQAIVRDTWDASAVSLTQSDFTSLAISSNVVTLGTGNPITLGLRVGDVIQFSGLSAAGNNGKNIRISGITATTFTSADTLTDMGADTTCGIIRPKKLIQSGTLVKRYFTIDEYDSDIDQSTTMQDFVWGSIKFSMQPNGLLTADPGGVGTGQISALATGSSPLLTSPSQTSASPLSVVDATIRVGGVDVVALTGLDITLDTSPMAPDVFGSGAIKYSPDVFTGQMSVALNLSALRKDLQYLTDFIAETPYTLHVLAEITGNTPKDFVSFYVPNFTMGGNTRSQLQKAGGPLTETISIPAALVGKDTTGAGYDATMIKIQSTGA